LIKPISIWSTSAEIILAHHEKYDGTGYPLGKKKEEIPLGSKILSVAEVFDVLTSKNSYKEPIGFTAALNEIAAHSGSQFDPEIVKAFETSIEDSDLILD
jgi:HD-GYP domain-containing protein (c-di-GMP phosphodiesterase class II)